MFMSSEGFSEEMATTDTAQFGGLTITTAAGIDLGGFRIQNLATPVAGTDAVTKNYVDAIATGLDWKQSVRLATAAALPAYTAAGSGVGKTLTANANGALSVDGVAVLGANRILVKSEGASHADHGIYTVTATGSAGTPFVLTRATDFDQAADVTAGAAVFVEEGTTNADTGWVLTTDDAIVIDTTALAFSQFTGTGAIIAGAGLAKTGNQLDVELDTGADAQGAGNGGGNSGLEFDAAGAGGKLRAKVDPAGGIQRSASGLALEIDDTPDTLDVGANGLKVVGLPSLFKINGTAVGANVTATNVDALVDGNPITGLHFHRDTKTLVAVDEAVAVGDPLVAGTTADRVQKGRADTDAKSYVLGLAETAQAVVGNNTRMVRHGVASGVLVGATVGQRFYLAATGGLSAANTPPGAGNRVILLGIAKSATDMWMNVIDYGKKAA
jgi:hypothetical protein